MLVDFDPFASASQAPVTGTKAPEEVQQDNWAHFDSLNPRAEGEEWPTGALAQQAATEQSKEIGVSWAHFGVE